MASDTPFDLHCVCSRLLCWNWLQLYMVTLLPQNSACKGQIFKTQKGVFKLGKSRNIHYKLVKMGPLVHIKKLSYLSPFIAIAQYTLLQLTSFIMDYSLWSFQKSSKAWWDIAICKRSVWVGSCHAFLWKIWVWFWITPSEWCMTWQNHMHHEATYTVASWALLRLDVSGIIEKFNVYVPIRHGCNYNP